MGPVVAFFSHTGSQIWLSQLLVASKTNKPLSRFQSKSGVSLPPKLEQQAARRQSVNLFGTGTFSNCGGHWSFPTFSINFAAPHLGFQILQVLVQGLKAEEDKRRVQSQHRWKQLGKVQCFETSVFKSL